MQETTLKSLEKQIDDLARVTKRGFDEINKRFEKVDERFGEVNDHFRRVDARLDMLERDVSYIRQRFVTRDEFDDLLFRVEILEKQMGIAH